MKHFLSSTILILCVLGASVHAEGPAGIVLYFKSGEEVFLLMADHVSETSHSRGWAAFGGGAEVGESAAETAARETEEETRGYFSSESLYDKIRDATPVLDGTFSLFFAEVTFVPAVRVQNNHPPANERYYVERGPYAWIPFSVVRQFLVQTTDMKRIHEIGERFLPSERNTDWFWTVWIRNLRKAVEADALPWD